MNFDNTRKAPRKTHVHTIVEAWLCNTRYLDEELVLLEDPYDDQDERAG